MKGGVDDGVHVGSPAAVQSAPISDANVRFNALIAIRKTVTPGNNHRRVVGAVRRLAPYAEISLASFTHTEGPIPSGASRAISAYGYVVKNPANNNLSG